MKQNCIHLLAVLLSIGLLCTGCGAPAESSSPPRLQIVCTIFPEYDWVRQLTAGVDGIQITLLIQGGADLHSYQPSVKDIAAIAEADLFCYVGSTSDQWAEDVLRTAENHTVQLVSMAEAADADEEVTVEGMQEEHHHDHDHDHDHEQDHDTEHEAEPIELDEHVWLSLRRAQMACAGIRDALCTADPEHASAYTQNCEAYVQQLQALDKAYTETVSGSTCQTILVADRFPFRYLADDYGLTYYAAFPGCSADTEASFETIVFLSEQVREQNLPCVLTVEGSDQTLARTVLENADSTGEILTLHSLQSVSRQEIESGVTYLSVMEENRQTLAKALTCPKGAS